MLGGPLSAGAFIEKLYMPLFSEYARVNGTEWGGFVAGKDKAAGDTDVMIFPRGPAGLSA